MGKTKQIGVRFDEELLAELKEKGISTPQRALSFLESNYKSETAHNRELGEKLIDAARGREGQDIKVKGKKPVKVVNLTSEAPKTNISINTSDEPIRQRGEDAIDFAMRKNEWKLKNKR